MTEICGEFFVELVPLETDAVVLLYAEVVWRGLVVTVRLPVAGILVKTVALPVVSDVDDDVVRVNLDVDRVKGVTVRFLVSEEVDSATLDPVPVPPEEVLLETGKGTVEDSPVRVADSVSVAVLVSFVLVSDDVELCPLVVVETLSVPEVEGVTEVSEVPLVSDALLCVPEVVETSVAVVEDDSDDSAEVDKVAPEEASVEDIAPEEPVDPVVV